MQASCNEIYGYTLLYKQGKTDSVRHETKTQSVPMKPLPSGSVLAGFHSELIGFLGPSGGGGCGWVAGA